MSCKESLLRGINSSKEGKYSEAKNYFLECLKTIEVVESNLYEKALYNYGIICLKLGEYEEAIESFGKLTAIKPEYLTEIKSRSKYLLSWHNKIFAYRKLWRLSDAESDLSEAL